MVFSSLRSRNRHSANPNPRLHTGASRDAHTHRNTHTDPHTSTHSETQIHKDKTARKNIHDTQTHMCRGKEFSNSLWQQEDGAHTLVCAHTLRNGLNSHVNPQHGCRDITPPQADSPPPSPHSLPRTLSQDTSQNFTPSDSTHRSDLHSQAPPPPPFLPACSASSLGSRPSFAPLIVPAVEKIERCRHVQSLRTNRAAPASLPGPAPITVSSCSSQPVSRDDGVTEGKRLTNQPRQWESGDPMPKKKPRKSSMPVKIERERVEQGGSEEEEC